MANDRFPAWQAVHNGPRASILKTRVSAPEYSVRFMKPVLAARFCKLAVLGAFVAASARREFHKRPPTGRTQASAQDGLRL